jgi:hypothetical protein
MRYLEAVFVPVVGMSFNGQHKKRQGLQPLALLIV